MARGRRHLVAVALLVAALSPRAVRAEPPDRAACVAAYEGAQTSMRRGSLKAAREQLGVCLDDACSRVLRTDCAKWLDEVEARLPKVVLGCEGPDGAARSDVRVTVDGQPFAERALGKAIEIDPGEHVFRFELPGEAPLEVRTLVHEGDKLQRVVGRFPRAASQGADVTRAAGARPIPWTVYALGSLGIAAAGGFTAFGLAGLSGKDDLEACRPDCTGSEISSVRTKFIVADVFMVVSIASLVGATYLYLTRGTTTVPASR